MRPVRRFSLLEVLALVASGVASITFMKVMADFEYVAPPTPSTEMDVSRPEDQTAENPVADIDPGYEENPCGGKMEMARITARDKAAHERADKERRQNERTQKD